MNVSQEIVRAGIDDLLPFLFIIIGVAFQVFESKKKKAKQERESQEAEYDVPPTSTPPVFSKRENDWKELVENYRQKTVAPEPVKKPVQKVVVNKSRKPEPVKQEKAEPIVAPVAQNPAQQIRSAMNVPSLKMPAMSLGPKLSSGGTGSAKLSKLGLTDREVLRRVVLSQEILGKPKGLESIR